MIRSKIKQTLFFILALLMLSCLTSSCLLLRYLPDNEISIALFKTIYNLPFGKKSILEFYSPAREEVRGYVPLDVNQFLIQNLEETNDEDELSAIVNFYAIQANEHRLGYLINISEQAKIKIINQAVKELNDEATLGGKLMMLEEIRTGKSLGKGSVGILNNQDANQISFSSAEEYRKWFYEQSAPIIIEKYQKWWNSNASWEEKKKINPLEGTNIEVSQCCG